MFGNVITYDPNRLFGFAAMRDERSAFFHLCDFVERPESIEYSDLLTFDLVEMPRGPRAVRIEVIDTEIEQAAHVG